MKGVGPKGQFAQLECKYRHEIPMEVLLPRGGPVRPTISGTDCDGIREVEGIVAVYEAKATSALPISKGQFKALSAVGTFFVESRWVYHPIDENSPAASENEEIARENKYTHFSVPVSAIVYAKPAARKWLRDYLKDCGFNATRIASDGFAFDFPNGRAAIETHIFRPTKGWLCLAYLPDYYAKYTKQDKYCYQTWQSTETVCAEP